MATPFHEALTQEIFTADPRTAFLTFLEQQGVPVPQRRFLKGQFSNIEDKFKASLGKQLVGGKLPTTSFFNDFLPQFDLQQFRRKFAPSARGEGTSRLTPRTRFDFLRR